MTIINPDSPDRNKREKPLRTGTPGAERLFLGSFVLPGTWQSDPLLIIGEMTGNR